MTLHVYNTLNRQVQPLGPLSSGKVGLYVCGPTVYDDPHLGHARSAVIFDVITRYLRARGISVTHVRNITDIDDKIIEKARRLNRDVERLSRFYTQRYREAMGRLNTRPPDAEPLATEFIPSIRELIAKLIHGGHAYPAGGSVYFAVESFKNYGRLSGRSLQSAASTPEAGAVQGKKHPADFALWKAAKPEEPSWPSPWGRGRPGWHIECSAMSAALLGETFDLHGGGQDLIFPHHENEIAQSQSLFGMPPANCWIHHGLVSIHGQKMSKSLGNTLTLTGLLECYPPAAVRLFLLSRHYRRPLEFSAPAMQASCAALARLEGFLACCAPANLRTGHAAFRGGELWQRFCAAMDGDFNFPMALAVVFGTIRRIHRDGGPPPAVEGSPLADLQFICREVFGIGEPTQA